MCVCVCVCVCKVPQNTTQNTTQNTPKWPQNGPVTPPGGRQRPPNLFFWTQHPQNRGGGVYLLPPAIQWVGRGDVCVCKIPQNTPPKYPPNTPKIPPKWPKNGPVTHPRGPQRPQNPFFWTQHPQDREGGCLSPPPPRAM